MPSPRVLILRAPGTNCDVETAYAFQCAGAVTESVHINRLLESGDLLPQFQVLCIPGGFSYGDDLAAGRILGSRIQHHLADRLQEFRAAGKLMLGICNGFQVLMKSGLLPDVVPSLATNSTPAATLTWNDTGRFEDRWVRLAVAGERCVFLRGVERMYLPIAHAEGKFVARDQPTLDALEENGHLVLRYTSNGSVPGGQLGFPCNPNGSQRNVAGICDGSGRVLGLMPHPERHIDPTQHPRWTRGEAAPTGDGLAVFRNAVEYLQ